MSLNFKLNYIHHLHSNGMAAEILTTSELISLTSVHAAAGTSHFNTNFHVR